MTVPTRRAQADRQRLPLLGVLLSTVAILTLVATSCAGDEASADRGSGPAHATVASSVPADTTLRIADQQRTLQTPLDASGETKELGFTPVYSTFEGGPPLIEAFRAGEVDVGYVGDTPPILAAAARQDIVILAAWRYGGNTMSIVAPPGKHIDSVADLKGKKFAYSKGTALQAFALAALKQAKLKESDVDRTDLKILDIVGALKSGDVDAGVVVEPILSQYLAANPGATVVRDSQGLSTNLSFVISSKKALADPAKAAAIGNLLTHENAAFGWIAQNRDAFTKAFAEANKVPADIARSLSDRVAVKSYLPLDGKVLSDEQGVADLFYQAGVIPAAVDVDSIVDHRFEGSPGSPRTAENDEAESMVGRGQPWGSISIE